MTNTVKEYYSLVESKMRWPWGRDRLGVPCQQSFVHRPKQRFETFQAASHGATGQVQPQQPPLVKQPLRRAVAGVLVDEDLHPYRGPQQSLGNQLVEVSA